MKVVFSVLVTLCVGCGSDQLVEMRLQEMGPRLCPLQEGQEVPEGAVEIEGAFYVECEGKK